MSTVDFDVAIVGFGPAGAVAACLLGQAGIKTVVIEKSDMIYDKPRAIALDHEIMRVFQGIGIADAIAPYVEPFTASEYFGVGGRLIKRLTMLPEPHPQGWVPSMVFLQPAVETVLRDCAMAMASVDIRLNQSVTGLTQDEDGVVLDIETASGPRQLSARYVVGCDGASSAVRKLAGLELEDLGFDQPWLVVDVLVNEKGLAKLPKTSVQYCEPERPTTFVIGTGRHRRWEIRLDDHEDRHKMESPEEVWRLLKRWITPEDGELWRSASYRFHALVAREWRNGRLFIAGDAAHQQPPFLGQGLCQGVRDVANLVWKLERVLRHEASPDLLDSYGVERSAHVRKLTTIIKGIGGLVGERDPVLALERDNRLIAEADGVIKSVPRQDLMPGLEAGCLTHVAHVGRGALFPQPWVETGNGRQRMDDDRGAGLRIVTVLNDEQVRHHLAAIAASMGALLIVVGQAKPECEGAHLVRECDGLLRQWFEKHNASIALVRPDHYVFGLASDIAGIDNLEREWHRMMTPVPAFQP